MDAEDGSFGKITSGLRPDTIILKTLNFVQSQLAPWRDDPEREPAELEEVLNGQLCKFLNVAARSKNFDMAHFHHEERQTGSRRVDLSAQPLTSTLIEGRLHSIYKTFLVLEGKRLPAPEKRREKEYLKGTDKISGGIERFKEGLHGRKLQQCAMIAYVQKEDCRTWYDRINEWIEADSYFNASRELLTELCVDTDIGKSTCWSRHSRTNSETKIVKLAHLWIEIR